MRCNYFNFYANTLLGMSSTMHRVLLRYIIHPGTHLTKANFTCTAVLHVSCTLPASKTAQKVDSKVGTREDARLTIVKQLCKAFGCSRLDAVKVMNKNGQFQGTITLTSYENTLKFLREQGVSDDNILQNYWILNYERGNLEKQLSRLTDLFCLDKSDTAVVIPYVKMPPEKIEKYVKQWQKELQGTGFPTRIHFLADALKCTKLEVVHAMDKVNILHTVSNKKIMNMLALLQEYGISTEHVLADAWVFLHNQEKLRHRFKLAVDAGVTCLKPWYGRTSEDIFQKMLSRKQNAASILEECGGSVEEYLAKRLECDTEYIEKLKKKKPRLPLGNIAKLRDIIDYLYENGYTPEEVRDGARILCHRLDLTRSRIEQLHALGHRPQRLIALCRSQRSFAEYISKLPRVVL